MPLSGAEGQEMLFEKGVPPQAISQKLNEGEYARGTLCPNNEAAGNSLLCIIRLNEPVPNMHETRKSFLPERQGRM